MTAEQQKYPIGKYSPPSEITENHIAQWSSEIAQLPERLERMVMGLTTEQLNTPYREGGWTVRQVVHHLADSHMNSIIRFRLALTEEKPTIRPYFEDRWAELPDAKTATISPSLAIIRGVHQRWEQLLKHMTSADWKKVFVHPEYNKEFSLEVTLGLYAWHGNHHLAHIGNALKECE